MSKAPGSVQAAAILLYVGGGLVVVPTLISFVSGAQSALRSGVTAGAGLVYLVLARAVQQGRPWGRRLVLVTCVIGVALAGLQLAGSRASGAVSTLAWPVVYAILLNTGAARSWFGRAQPEPAAEGPEPAGDGPEPAGPGPEPRAG